MSLLHIMAFPVAPNVNRKNIVENLLFSLIILLHILKHVYISMELQKFILITARKRSLGQGNIFTSVCHSFCPGGGSASGGWQTPLPIGYGQRAGGTHPTGVHSCYCYIQNFRPTWNKMCVFHREAVKLCTVVLL